MSREEMKKGIRMKQMLYLQSTQNSITSVAESSKLEGGKEIQINIPRRYEFMIFTTVPRIDIRQANATTKMKPANKKRKSWIVVHLQIFVDVAMSG